MVAESIVLRTAQDCTPAEREAFLTLVTKGGEVNPSFARAGIERAQRLAFAFVGEHLAGVACLKLPLNSYKNRVFEKAKSSAHPNAFNAELGYVSVDPDFQGRRLSSKLTDALLNGSSPKVFATSAVGNSRMHATLERFGFRREGEAYSSEDDPERRLYLFVRE